MSARKVLALLGLIVGSAFTYGEVVIPPMAADQLSVLVDVIVEYDGKNDTYTYSYTLSNSPASHQEIDFFALAVQEDKGSVLEAASPAGWRFSKHVNEDFLSWQAVEGVPNDYVDDGGVPPSLFQIKPGQTLSGFSIVSKNLPADTGYYVQGYTPLPAVTGDVEELDDEGYEIRHFSQNSVSGLIKGPIGEPVYFGNRRPDVDGFLGLVNFNPESNEFTLPKKFVVRFALGGESVDQSTFTAMLNRQDVTSQFVVDGSGAGDLALELNDFDGISRKGRNVLILSVEGISPKNGKLSKDTDRIVFELF